MTVPFENDTGNIVRKLARKSLKSEKRRNLMVVIAVALASCLICFSIVMALSTRQIEKNHVEDTYEAVYTRITEEDVSTLKGLDAITAILQMYRPLLLKYAIIDGVLDEDLYQELSIILLKAIKLFKI